MANVTASLNYKDPLNMTVSCILLVIGVFGVVCNSSIVLVFYKERSERTSFNLICVFRALSNIYILATTFLALFLPKTLLGFSPYSPALECWLIHISNTLYMGNEYQIILVACNRFIAMFLPFYYHKLCGFFTTLFILLAIYIFRIAIVIYETAPQTALQDSLYLIDLSFMIKLSQLSDARFWSYISGNFVWQCLHSIDGFIMIMFNERLSLLKKQFLASSQTSAAPPKMTISAMPEVG
ncbi:unnamed protein product [Caenorhabditis sp. 36 PRJEB53466]|nr:unnamed protein product [Caenorhabditis sp. 36 PRJEB53466]